MYPGPSALKDGPAVLATFLLIGFLVFVDQHGYHKLYNWVVGVIVCGGGLGFVVTTLWWAFGPRR